MADQLDPFLTALRELSAVLDPRRGDWAIAGAVAANYHRDQTRTTNDLDVLLSLPGGNVAGVERLFHERGWVTRSRTEHLLRLRHPAAGDVDIIIAAVDYERSAIARARPARLDDHLAVKILSVEDVLILKLIAYRTRDVMDVESILLAKPALDWGYMNRCFDYFREFFDLDGRYREVEETVVATGQVAPQRRNAVGDAGTGE